MPTRKLWDHTIDVKEGFILRKGKVYLLSGEEREEAEKKREEKEKRKKQKREKPVEVRKVMEEWEIWDEE